MPTLQSTHCFQLTTTDGKRLSPTSERELISSLRDNGISEISTSLGECSFSPAVWISKLRNARLGLWMDRGMTCIIVAPATNFEATTDFKAMYSAVMHPNPAQQKDAGYLLNRMRGHPFSDGIAEHIKRYANDADDLLEMALKQAYQQGLRAKNISPDLRNCPQFLTLRRYLPSVYFQVEQPSNDLLKRLTNTQALIEKCQQEPFSFEACAALRNSSYISASIETRLISNGYTAAPIDDYVLWSHAGKKSVVSMPISEATLSNLKSIQGTFFANTASIAKEQLPPWFTYFCGVEDLLPLGPTLDANSHKRLLQSTGAALLLEYPEGCRAILLSTSPDPLDDEAIYTPIKQQAKNSEIFTLGMFFEPNGETMNIA